MTDLSKEELDQIRGYSDSYGETRVASVLMVHVATVNRALALRELRPSTVQCIRSRLKDLSGAFPQSEFVPAPLPYEEKTMGTKKTKPKPPPKPKKGKGY